ncbi:MAG: ABC transporter substrate-binding protein [Azospirillaceae bacterium]
MTSPIDLTTSRRSLMKAAGTLGSVAAVQGVATTLLLSPMNRALAQTREVQTMRSTAKSWLWAGEDFAAGGGFFEEVGLNVVSNASGRGVNVNALIGGAVDIVLGAPGQTMRAQAQGQPIKIIAGTVNKYASNIVVNAEILAERGVDESSPVEEKIEAMRGLRLGTTGPGAAPDNLFRYLFDRVGIDPDADVELVSVQGGGSGMLAGMERGTIDGFCLSSPTSDVAVQQFGAAYLFNMATNPPEELEDYLYIVAQVSDETIAERRELVFDYCRGTALALRAIHQEPETFRAWAMEWFEGLDPELFDTAFATNSQIYMPNPIPTERHFELNKTFVNQGFATLGEDPLPDDFGFLDAYDPSIAEEATAAIE